MAIIIVKKTQWLHDTGWTYIKVFSTFFKLYKWYQIVQNIAYEELYLSQ